MSCLSIVDNARTIINQGVNAFRIIAILVYLAFGTSTWLIIKKSAQAPMQLLATTRCSSRTFNGRFYKVLFIVPGSRIAPFVPLKVDADCRILHSYRD
ncbi:uncharacterized protein LOC103721487 [Phoenix dactylifera]|uniref:Uncharacterized protein LOC103721487 n=1 Tax=Phoenix dactylifera TaxID=42345 RepID=A0A8B8JC65_PHODC|nr:uncharacterized protein LOC103721487 [Phoenix dactylifera]